MSNGLPAPEPPTQFHSLALCVLCTLDVQRYGLDPESSWRQDGAGRPETLEQTNGATSGPYTTEIQGEPAKGRDTMISSGSQLHIRCR